MKAGSARWQCRVIVKRQGVLRLWEAREQTVLQHRSRARKRFPPPVARPASTFRANPGGYAPSVRRCRPTPTYANPVRRRWVRWPRPILQERNDARATNRIARFVLEPAFEHGMFYADPHPGNLLLEEDGSLSVIDFGKVGRLTPAARRRAADLFIAIARSDGQRLADRLIEITAPRTSCRPRFDFERDRSSTRAIRRCLA